MNSAPSGPFGIDLAVPPELDLELEWFIDKRVHEAAMAAALIDRDPNRLWEKSAIAAIGGWLRAMDAYDADILRCAYAPVEPPRRSLGRLTHVFARFAGAEPGWPDAIDWRAAMRPCGPPSRSSAPRSARTRASGAKAPASSTA